MEKIACVYYDSVNAYLDHLIPLSYLLNTSVFFEDEKLFQLAQKFYPQANLFQKHPLSYKFLADNFNVLISCDIWFEEDKFSFENFHKNKMKLILCPHGNSDKGHIMSAKMQAYASQDMVLLYGNHMIQLLKSLKIFDKLKQFAVVGNFRLSFYMKFKKFYDKITNEIIFSKLNKKNKTILYAPTWKDQENSSSFFQIFEKLIKKIPAHYNLIIKPHPNLERKNPVEFYQMYKENFPKNILFLQDFPIIYPLLNKCDIYLGDFSSIGYDFLFFQKPMFFLDHLERDKINSPSLFLHRCGQTIPKDYWDNIFDFIDKNLNDDYKKIQNEIYHFTYGKEKKLSEIKKIIIKAL